MASTKELEAQLADLAARVARLEAANPDVARERALAERRATKAKLAGLDLDGYAKLDSAARGVWCGLQGDERLVELLRTAKPKLRSEILGRLPWARQATVTFALTPHVPALVEVTFNAGFQIRIGSKAFTPRKGDTKTYYRHEWDELSKAEPRLVEWLGDGSLTLRELSDSEARAYETKRYLAACHALAGAQNGARPPGLPSLD